MDVLVAEDDVNILEGVVRLLQKEGYNVRGVKNGALALEEYQKKSPDFIILDIMMPEKSGYDVCREIRQSDAITPIIFLSAKSEEIDKVVGLELGADDFVSKPFGTRELMARVRAISRRTLAKTTPLADSFEMYNITVLPSELRAKKDDIIIDLGPRDIQILTLLFEKQGKVVTRHELFDRCWGTDFAGSSRTLDQHISQLRKKIEDKPKEPQIIETVHGVGYSFRRSEK